MLCSFLITNLAALIDTDFGFALLPAFAEGLTVAVIYCIITAIFKTNRIVWRYAGSSDYVYLLVLSIASGIISFGVNSILKFRHLSFMYCFFAVFMSSAVVVFSRAIYQGVINHRTDKSGPGSKRLIIIGAGLAGVRLLGEIYSAPGINLVPFGFIDDDVQKIGRIVSGLKVLGNVSDIGEICEKNGIECIYIAIPSISNERRSEILDECLKTGLEVKILPLLTELAEKDDLISNVRSITPEELLGRAPVSLADDEMLDFLNGKTIAITGGGGSIGSEICRKIAAHDPKKLIIVDVYENNAYSLEQELISKYPSLNLTVYIATVCDKMKISKIFEKEKPELVIHAAAHKHVPLMETVPDEAVKNNVFGTFNTCLAARDAGVEKFVLISSDKAVNPTNVMGATKRICEMLIQCMDKVSPDTSFSAVRFGNVLGSNGSVIPLFKSQIEQRHDVTVTDPNMIRYFMTISEASQLVLMSAALAKGGEIFVLDMGEPVKIDDLARNMIRLSGLTLGRDINIKYIGLRPGEKLYEELLMSEEGLTKTGKDKIFVGKPIEMDNNVFMGKLRELKAVAEDPNASSADVIEKIMDVVPTFTHELSVEDTKA